MPEASQLSQHSSWSNDRASWNIFSAQVTEEVSHEERGWLNDEAEANMYDMDVTEEVLREKAPRRIAQR